MFERTVFPGRLGEADATGELPARFDALQPFSLIFPSDFVSAGR